MADEDKKTDEKKPVEDAHRKSWKAYKEARGCKPEDQNTDGMINEYTRDFVQGFGKELQDPNSPVYEHFKPAYEEDALKEYGWERGEIDAREGEDLQHQKDIDAVWDAYEKNEQDAAVIINKQKELGAKEQELAKGRKEMGAEYERVGKERQQVAADRAKAEQMRVAAEEKEKEVEEGRKEIDGVLKIYEGLPEPKDYTADLEKIRAASKEVDALVGPQEKPGPPVLERLPAKQPRTAQDIVDVQLGALNRALAEAEEPTFTPEQIGDVKKQIEGAYKEFEQLREINKKTFRDIKANLSTAEEALEEGPSSESVTIAVMGVQRAYSLMESLKEKRKELISPDVYSKWRLKLDPYTIVDSAADKDGKITLLASEEEYTDIVMDITEDAAKSKAAAAKAEKKAEEIEGSFEVVKDDEPEAEKKPEYKGETEFVPNTTDTMTSDSTELAVKEEEKKKAEEHAEYLEKEIRIRDGFKELTGIRERLDAIKGNEKLARKLKPRLEHTDTFVKDALDAYGQDELANPQVYETFSEKLTSARTYLEMMEAAEERIEEEPPAPQEPAKEPVPDEKTAKMKAEAEKGIAELEKVLGNYEKDDKTANIPRDKLSVAREAYEKGDYEDAMGKAFMGLGMVDKKKKKKADAKKETGKKPPAGKKKDDIDEILGEDEEVEGNK